MSDHLAATDLLHLVVARRSDEGDGVAIVELVDRNGGELPGFEAGAHIDLHLGEDLVRQYSLSNDPAERGHYRLGILRDRNSRGGSRTAHDRLTVGAEIAVGRPRNHFPLTAGADHSILVGGGIGITPMIAMAHALHAAGRSFELHYSSRSRAASAFLDEFAHAPFASRVSLKFDDAPELKLDLPACIAAAPRTGTHLYVCGPAGFMDWVIGTARAAGLADDKIHREYFSADVDTTGAGFEVFAARSNQTVRVGETQTIVEALNAIGIEIDVSCREGVCGTCLCNVLEGECDHRDVYLTSEERAANDQILVCCSRAKSPRLVLDI